MQDETKVHLQRLMDGYETGLHITEVKLQAVEPPEPVQAAFKDVVSAKEDRERIVNEARAYREDLLPKARGEAEQMIRAAEGYRESRVRDARGDTSRFLSMLTEYRQAKTVTRRRLFLEAMSEVLSKVDTVVVSARVAGKALPLLPEAHVVVLEADDIVGGYEEAWARLGGDGWGRGGAQTGQGPAGPAQWAEPAAGVARS